MRDHLAHRYFDTSHAILQATVDHDLPELLAAIHRLDQRLAAAEPAATDQPNSQLADEWMVAEE